MLRSKARRAVPVNRSVRSASRPNAFTTRMPTMLSSAASVTSATRCCTSTRTGAVLREYLMATAARAGPTISDITASTGLSHSRIPVMSNRVNRFMNMNTSP